MLSEIFFKNGRQLTLPDNYRLHLSRGEGGSVWYVEGGGSMSLFAARKMRRVEGRPIFISMIHQDHLLFDMKSESLPSYEIYVSTVGEVTLWELSVEELRASLPIHRLFSSFLIRWLSQFEALFSPSPEVIPDYWISHAGDMWLDRGKIFTLKANKGEKVEELLWLLPSEGKGEIQLLSPYKFSPTSLFPLFPHLHFLASRSTTLHVCSTEELVCGGGWPSALDDFHKFLMGFLSEQQSYMELVEFRRFKEKLRLQREMLHDALGEMAFVLNPKRSEKEMSISSDPLIYALQHILGSLSLPWHYLTKERAESSEVKECITKLAASAGACVREVSLSPLWWKRDSGPLLAFCGEGRIPVALIQNHLNEYEIISQRVRQKVREESARKLYSTAYSFYAAIPDDLQMGRRGVISYYLKQNKWALGSLMLYGFISSLFSLFLPVGVSIIFNNAIPNANLPLLMQVMLGIGVSALSTSLFFYFRALIAGRVDGLLSSQMQPALWDRLLKLPAKFFRRFTAGDLLQRVMAIEQMRPFLSNGAIQTIFTGIFSLLYIIVMAIYSIRLSVIGVGVMLLGLGITYICTRLKVKTQKKFYEMRGMINGALVQILSGISKLRVAGAENNAFSYWAKAFSKSKSLEMCILNIQSIITTIMAIFPLFSFAVIFIVFIMHMDRHEHLSIGNFLAFNTAFMTLSSATFSFSNTIMHISPITSLWKRSHVIIEEPPEILRKKSSPGTLTGMIRIDNISFRYEKGGYNVLTNISIRIYPRQMVGIVGPSGSGKSTLIRIILGFEIPHSGAIYFNDKELIHLDMHEVRKQMGVVLQEGGIIAGTLYQNLVAGGRYSEEDIDRAMTLSGFKRDLQNFPMGLHTVIPMHGETLSGGQRQRLLIARAILPNPRILLFDEATSALDNRSQNEITRNIGELNMTRVVIAHRLSTIKDADYIYVIEQGRVVQSGSFQELVGEEGLFREMLERQTL